MGLKYEVDEQLRDSTPDPAPSKGRIATPQSKGAPELKDDDALSAARLLTHPIALAILHRTQSARSVASISKDSGHQAPSLYRYIRLLIEQGWLAVAGSEKVPVLRPGRIDRRGLPQPFTIKVQQLYVSMIKSATIFIDSAGIHVSVEHKGGGQQVL